MCSGGKDSMASAILCYENGIHLDGVVIAEIMFSHEKNISAEHPKHAEWLHNVAIPTLENKFGYNVVLLKSKKDYVQHFHGRISKSEHAERIGKKHGFVLGGNKCSLKRDCKIAVTNKWCKEQGDFEKIVGIAFDETKRLDSLHKQKNAYSVLERYRIAESMTYDIDRKYNLLSPYYDMGMTRQGCWFCPSCSIDEFSAFARNYPELWEELRIMSQDTETVSKCFKYNRTFQSVDDEITLINGQQTLFDLEGR
jgi:hypothetical protein